MPLLDILRRHPARLPFSPARPRNPRPPSPTSPVCRRCLTWTSSLRLSTSRASKPRRAPRTAGAGAAVSGVYGGRGGAVGTAAHFRWWTRAGARGHNSLIRSDRFVAGAPPRMGEARQAVPRPRQAATAALLVDNQPRAPRPSMARLLVLHASEGERATFVL